MHSLCSLPFFCLLLPVINALAPTNLVYEFPNGTWLENLAVRSCGSILLTIITSPDLYLIDPLSPSPTPTLLHHFDDALWLTGITETSPDTFQIVVANGTLKNLDVAPGSNRIYTVSFPPGSDVPDVSLAATVPDAEFLNGLTTLNPTTVLAADSQKGVIWAIDTVTGASRIAIDDPLFKYTPAIPNLGVNGLKLRGSTLYFTNSAQALLAKVEINADGTAASQPTVIAYSAPGTAYDDFALDWRGDAFLTTGAGNSVELVSSGGELQVVVAGNVNSTEIAEPTAAQFGKRGEEVGAVLYVTTGGGLAIPVDGDEIVGGQLVAVDTRGVGRA
ncbi:hypothetical protein MMC28_001948 [Mycoblastus sanguinarius]|nr:hypothetical protein [Mycoblastus sanguinarius]